MSEEFLKCNLGFLGNTEGSAYLSQGIQFLFLVSVNLF